MTVRVYANQDSDDVQVMVNGEPASDVLDIFLPDDLDPGETEGGEVYVTLSGRRYPLRSVLAYGYDGQPFLYWYDGTGYAKRILTAK